MAINFTNPTVEQVQSALDRTESDANHKARERTCGYPDSLAEKIVRTKDGICQKDGGGVANCYGYAAHSTVLAAAWYTDPLTGEKRVVIDGCRTRCSGRHVTPMWTAYATAYGICQSALDQERCQEKINAIGEWSESQNDDRLQIRRPFLLAESEEGLLIGDSLETPSIVQVVVRDATTGHRHQITVPPKFGRKDRRTYQDLMARGGESLLIHAAIAWTFRLSPEAYAPAVQA